MNECDDIDLSAEEVNEEIKEYYKGKKAPSWTLFKYSANPMNNQMDGILPRDAMKLLAEEIIQEKRALSQSQTQKLVSVIKVAHQPGVDRPEAVHALPGERAYGDGRGDPCHGVRCAQAGGN